MTYRYRGHAISVYKPAGAKDWHIKIDGHHSDGYETRAGAIADAKACVDQKYG